MDKSTESYKYLFIGGCGRSGTTLLQKMFVIHSKIDGGPEFSFTKDIFELYKKMSIAIKNGYLDKFVSENTLISIYKAYYNQFFYHFCSKEIKYISEKTPSNIFVINELLEVFPDAIFINVVRDGRAVLNSHLKVKKRYKKKNKFAGFNLFSVCKLWNQSVSLYLQNKDHKNVYNIYYEDLIQNTKVSLKKLMVKLDLELEERMLNPETIQLEEKNKAHINDIWYTQNMYNQGINKKNIYKWQKELNFIQIFLANSLMAINLNKLGYNVSPVYIKINQFLKSLSKDNFRKQFWYKYYLKVRLAFS